MNILWHFLLSRSCDLNPLSHTHWYDPGMFIHPCEHSEGLDAHSFMSIKTGN